MSKGNIILVMEVLVAVVAIFTYYKYKQNNLRYFLLYLWSIVIVEALGTFVPGQSSNYYFYNSFAILEFPLLVLWYRSFISDSKSRNGLLWLIGLFLVFVIINTSFFQSYWNGFQSYNFIMGAICLIIAIFLYFNEVLHSEKILFIQRGLLFWVSVGFLFFYASVIPIMVMGNFIHHNGWIYNVFLLILNIILHICFLIGLLWGQMKYN